MKQTTIFFAIVAGVVAVIWLTGCDTEDHHRSMNNDTGQLPQIVSVYPPDGATGVATTTAVNITFDMPMDTLSVMAGFHFTGGDDMHEWMDSLEHHSNMGTMNMNHMMDWMDSIEYHGQFYWNENMDSCRFVPDSTLMPNTDYMLFLYGNIKSHNGMMMDRHHLDYDGYMYHFRTGP
jgi:hypothetical protein